MPIDVNRLVGARLPDSTYSWDADQAILYHLGVGAGADPTDAAQLRYTYEQGLTVLPTFAVIPAFGVVAGLAGLDGFAIDHTRLLHGEQRLILHTPVRPADTVRTTGRVTAVLDKGSGAVVVVETESRSTVDQQLCFTNVFSSFIRGEGGFGGDRGRRAPVSEPEGPPDLTVERATLPQQALLYRLCGDKNPIHADPALAAAAGFDRPILHGLCTYGIVCQTVVDEMLGGDVTRVVSYDARFAGVVYPGETLVVQMWRTDAAVLVAAHTKDRGDAVLRNVTIALKETT
ncbi:MaoC/PaaZ C-terminal domain-containing protein [Micromonosporaceae bacterium B7E4]